MRTKDGQQVAAQGEPRREKRFQHNDKLNGLLETLSGLLAPLQAEENKNHTAPAWPVGLILGPPRSGTTVLQQFLAATGCFSYPSNLLTRFAYAPYVGALIQKMLLDPEYDYQGDFRDIQSGINFESDLGKSRGALAANEFFHFWRKYMDKFFPEPFSEQELEAIRYDEMSAALASIEAAFGKPFCAKGMLHQYNLGTFFQHQPYLFFFRIVREPLYICQSLLFSREKYYGNRETWWSAKPAEYAWLKDMDVYHQVAGQVYFSETAIAEGLQEVPESHQLTIDYQEFCKNPEAVYQCIVEKYAALGCPLPGEYNGEKTFTCGNAVRLPASDFQSLETAYADFAEQRVQAPAST